MQRCDVLSDSRRRDLHYEESVGVEAIPLVLLAEWTYSNCAVLLDKDPNTGQFWTTQSGPTQRDFDFQPT